MSNDAEARLFELANYNNHQVMLMNLQGNVIYSLATTLSSTTDLQLRAKFAQSCAVKYRCGVNRTLL